MASSSHKGAASDSTGSGMTLQEKRDLVYKLSKESQNALKNVLKEWSCDEIRSLLCSESKKPRKYTGVNKDELINKLYRTLTEENTGDLEVGETSSPPTRRNNSKRQRVTLNVFPNATPLVNTTEGNGTINCKNLACQLVLSVDDTFCKRCACCICHKYVDGEKDTSLWLTCDKDPPFYGCGLTCHVNCFFNVESSVMKTDGSFLCISCSKPNSLLECVKKNLSIANEKRRVDEVYYRLLMAQKLLKGTEKYKKLFEHVDDAVKSLESEFKNPLEMTKALMTRLDSGEKVMMHCSSALNILHGSFTIRFKGVHARSLTLLLDPQVTPSTGNTFHYSVWHRKVSAEEDYPNELTCAAIVSPNTSFVVDGLTPETEYCFKVVSLLGDQVLWEVESKVSTPTQEASDAAELVTFLGGSTQGIPPPSVELQVKNKGKRKVRQRKRNTQHVATPSSLEPDINSEDERRVCNITGPDVGQVERNTCTEEQHVAAPSSDERRVCIITGPDVRQVERNTCTDEQHVATPSSGERRVCNITGPDVRQVERNTYTEEQLVAAPSSGERRVCNITGPDVRQVERNTRTEEQHVATPSSGERRVCNITGPDVRQVERNTRTEEQHVATPSSDERRVCNITGPDVRRQRNRNTSSEEEEAVTPPVKPACMVEILIGLEKSGYVTSEFKKKFVTWYCLIATAREKRVVKRYAKAHKEDSSGLAGQLVDSFSESILRRYEAMS